MANNIPTTASFATAFMKPVTGEVVDALWGQKASDNSGWLLYRPVKVADFGGLGHYISGDADAAAIGTFVQTGTTRFRKEPFLNTLFGSYYGTVSAQGGFSQFTGFAKASINGVSLFTYDDGTSFATSFSRDISSLTNGNWYTITASAGAWPRNANNGGSAYGMIQELSVFYGA